MRKLRLVIALRSGALPALALATLVPAASCSGGDAVPEPPPPNPAGGAGGQGGDAGVGGGGFSFPEGGPDVDAGCACTHGIVQTHVVDVPPEGTPADPGAICAVMMPPAESNKAAHVTLKKDGAPLEHAAGFVAVPPDLEASVVGIPSIEVVSADSPALAAMQVSNVQAAPGGFSFDADWPEPLFSGPQRLTVRVTLEVLCDAQSGTTQLAEALTHIELCHDLPACDVRWVSSGDECQICEIIAEMAPSPIVPDRDVDELALGRVVRLRVTTLARVGRTHVLLAEHDGGPGMAIEWHASEGRLAELAPDVVVWEPPERGGPHQVQVAAFGDDAAAVASYSWKEVA